jgi:hypothetical protein
LDIGRIGKLSGYVSFLHAIDPVSESGNHGKILFNDDHRHFSPQKFKGFQNLFDGPRGQTFRRLVDKEQAR